MLPPMQMHVRIRKLSLFFWYDWVAKRSRVNIGSGVTQPGVKIHFILRIRPSLNVKVGFVAICARV